MLEAQDARLALSLLIIPPVFPSRGAQQTQREVSWQPTADRHRSLCVVAHAAVRTRSPPALLLLLAVAHCAYQSEKNLASDRTMVGHLKNQSYYFIFKNYIIIVTPRDQFLASSSNSRDAPDDSPAGAHR